MTTINEIDATNSLVTMETQVLALGSTLERLICINHLPANLVAITQPYNATGGYNYRLVDTVKSQVYTKYFTGSISSSTFKISFPHGMTKETILNVSGMAMSATGTTWHGVDGDLFHWLRAETTNIYGSVMSTFGAAGATYKVAIQYTV